MKTRRKFSSSFKEEAVDLVKKSGKSTNQIAGELGISQTSLSRWIRESKTSPEGARIFSSNEALRRLREENRRLTMERDILKKTTAFFARESS